MKRYAFDTTRGEMFEIPSGAYVRYEDANAWWNEMKLLPRVQDVARIYELEQEVERLRTELAEVRVSCDKAMDEQHAKLVRVADEKRAANALLPKTWEAMGELTSVLMDGEHMLKVDDVRGVFESACAHLAAQPATAPAGDKPVFGSSPVGGANLRPEHRPSVGEFLAAQPATAPTKTEGEQ